MVCVEEEEEKGVRKGEEKGKGEGEEGAVREWKWCVVWCSVVCVCVCTKDRNLTTNDEQTSHVDYWSTPVHIPTFYITPTWTTFFVLY